MFRGCFGSDNLHTNLPFKGEEDVGAAQFEFDLARVGYKAFVNIYHDRCDDTLDVMMAIENKDGKAVDCMTMASDHQDYLKEAKIKTWIPNRFCNVDFETTDCYLYDDVLYDDIISEINRYREKYPEKKSYDFPVYDDSRRNWQRKAGGPANIFMTIGMVMERIKNDGYSVSVSSGCNGHAILPYAHTTLHISWE